jgi:hypothetical protein
MAPSGNVTGSGPSRLEICELTLWDRSIQPQGPAAKGVNNNSIFNMLGVTARAYGEDSPGELGALVTF